MKNLKITSILVFSFTILLFNCNNDGVDSTDDGPDNPEATLVERFVDSLQAASGITFKASTASLSNNATNQLNISSALTMQDDEFRFEANSNNQITLIWKQDHEINYQATSIDNINKDAIVQPITFQISESAEGILSGSNGTTDVSVVLDTNLNIELNIQKGTEAELDINLATKTTADYANFSQISNPVELFSIDAESVPIDIKYSVSQNSLYFLNRKSQFEQQFGKFNLNTNDLTVKLFDGLVNFDKQLEFVNDEILAVTAFEIARIDYNLTSDPELFNCNNSLESWYTLATYNNEIYSVGGYGPFGANIISKYNEAANIFEPFASMPTQKGRADGTIYNDKFYIFGGTYIDPNGQLTTYDSIEIYEMSTGTLDDELQLTNDVIQTYVARSENLIVVAGRAVDQIVENPNGNTIFTKPFLGVFNTLDNSFEEIDISQYFGPEFRMSGMTISNHKIYFVFVVPNASGLKVYEADLLQ